MPDTDVPMQQLGLLRRKCATKPAQQDDSTATPSETPEPSLGATTSSASSATSPPEMEGLEEPSTDYGPSVDSSVKSLSGALELADSFLSSLDVQSNGQGAEKAVDKNSEAAMLRKEPSHGSLLRRSCRIRGGLPSACLETKPSAGTLELQEAATSVFEAADLNASLPACLRREMDDMESSESEWERDPVAAAKQLSEAPGATGAEEKVEKSEASPGPAPAQGAPSVPSEPIFLPVRRRVRCKSKAPRPTCVEDGACDPSCFFSREDFEDFWKLVCRLCANAPKCHSQQQLRMSALAQALEEDVPEERRHGYSEIH